MTLKLDAKTGETPATCQELLLLSHVLNSEGGAANALKEPSETPLGRWSQGFFVARPWTAAVMSCKIADFGKLGRWNGWVLGKDMERPHGWYLP